MAAKNKTILFIEDDPDQLEMYSFAFTKAGYTVFHSRDGEEGIEIAHAKKPDLILLDILLPGINGIETLRLIRTDKTLANIPVVILTNYTKAETLKKGLELGAKEIIVKTDIVPHELVAKMKEKYL